MVATTLSAGDIAIVGFNFDNPDEFAFIPLIDIGSGTEINFTDNGWKADGTFRDTEGTFTWTAPTEITAGTVINPTLSSVAFSTSGDQIIAYQGDSSNPSFIYALNSEGTPGVWQADSTSSNTSALPTGLVNGETAVALDEIDNAIYTGITSGTQAELLEAISNKSNWSGDNSSRQNIPTTPFTVSGSSSNPVINEILVSHIGIDDTEFIEIFGTPGTSLDGLSFIVVEGDLSTVGSIDARIDFDSTNVIGDNGFFLVGNPIGLGNNYGVTPNLDIGNNFLENGSSTYALVETSSLSGNSVTGSEVVIDTVALTTGDVEDTFFFNAPVLGPDGPFFPPGARRVTDGVDTDTVDDFVLSDFNLGPDNTPTAGTTDDGGPDPTLIPIYEIQGSGTSSPIVGQTVVTEGIVTGDFQNGDADETRNLGGFYLQDETGDGDLTTSDGVFVFEGSNLIQDVNVGDAVRITGTVNEFFGETQITASTFEIIGSGSVAPTNIDLPTTSTVLNADGELIADLEQYEGMLINFPETLTVTELFNLDRFGELRVSEGGRLEQFTNNNAPSVPGFEAFLEDIASRTITIDDGLTIQNPDPIIYPAPQLDSSNTLRMGDTVTNLTGNVRFSRGSGGSGDETFRIMPTETPNFEEENLRPQTPEDVGGTLKVGSLNVLNYFTTLGNSGGTSGPNNLEPRGADNQAEFDRQQEKLVTAITGIDADVLGLIELENTDIFNGQDVVLENLVDAVNAELGSEVYEYISTGFIGGDAIKVGMIYKPTEVTPVGDFAILDSSVDPTFIDNRNRPALAQTFAEVETGEEFTIAVNHFKSKGSSGLSDPSDPNFDQGDGQGFWNAVRTDAAIALTNWLETDPTGSGDEDFLIVGDLNSYAQEDPIQAIEAAGYTNLAAQFIGPEAYSFVFDGQKGTLDYALTNPSLTSQVTGVTEWHINADEPDALDYNLDFGRNPNLFNGQDPFRTSDHDPIIVGLDLESSNPGQVIDGPNTSSNLVGTDGDDTITGFRRSDTLTGGGGSDTFVYTSLRDARDTITDFEVGSDIIDLSQVLDLVGYTGTDPIAEGYLGFASTSNSTYLTIDPDGLVGTGRPRSIVEVQGVMATELNSPSNFLF